MRLSPTSMKILVKKLDELSIARNYYEYDIPQAKKNLEILKLGERLTEETFYYLELEIKEMEEKLLSVNEQRQEILDDMSKIDQEYALEFIDINRERF